MSAPPDRAPPAPGRVSVIVTCYNEGPWIEQAVESVFAQTAAAAVAEVILADDGSDAATLAVLDRLSRADPRITVLRNQRYGIARNRNAAIRHSCGTLIAFLDADDVWLPTKLAEQLAILDADAATGLVYTGFRLFPNHAPDELTSVRVIDHTHARDLALSCFLDDPPIIPSSVLMRRSVFDLAGGFDESLFVFEDTEFFTRLARVTRFGAIVAPQVHKRNHASSITSRRQDLMMHHAFVAFHLGRTEPRLLPHVPRRLAERARKLGNLEARDGRIEQAARLYALARALRPFSARTWLAMAMLRLRVTALVYRLRAATSSTGA